MAAISAGGLYFAGQAGQIVFGSPSEVVEGVWVALVGIGVVALGIALWAFRGGWGGRIALAGFVLLALFVVGITTEAAPWHDIGLFVFEGAWVALGITLLPDRQRLP